LRLSDLNKELLTYLLTYLQKWHEINKQAIKEGYFAVKKGV